MIFSNKFWLLAIFIVASQTHGCNSTNPGSHRREDRIRSDISPETAKTIYSKKPHTSQSTSQSSTEVSRSLSSQLMFDQVSEINTKLELRTPQKPTPKRLEPSNRLTSLYLRTGVNPSFEKNAPEVHSRSHHKKDDTVLNAGLEQQNPEKPTPKKPNQGDSYTLLHLRTGVNPPLDENVPIDIKKISKHHKNEKIFLNAGPMNQAQICMSTNDESDIITTLDFLSIPEPTLRILGPVDINTSLCLAPPSKEEVSPPGMNDRVDSLTELKLGQEPVMHSVIEFQGQKSQTVANELQTVFHGGLEKPNEGKHLALNQPNYLPTERDRQFQYHKTPGQEIQSESNSRKETYSQGNMSQQLNIDSQGNLSLQPQEPQHPLGNTSQYPFINPQHQGSSSQQKMNKKTTQGTYERENVPIPAQSPFNEEHSLGSANENVHSFLYKLKNESKINGIMKDVSSYVKQSQMEIEKLQKGEIVRSYATEIFTLWQRYKSRDRLRTNEALRVLSVRNKYKYAAYFREMKNICLVKLKRYFGDGFEMEFIPSDKNKKRTREICVVGFNGQKIELFLSNRPTSYYFIRVKATGKDKEGNVKETLLAVDFIHIPDPGNVVVGVIPHTYKHIFS